MNNCCCAELVVDEGQQIELNVESDGGIEVGVAEQFVIGGGGNYQSKTVNITPTESAQSQTVRADVGYDALDEVEVNVAAVSDTYVGSAVPRRASSSLTVSGNTVTAPAGYYAQQASKSVPASVLEVMAYYDEDDNWHLNKTFAELAAAYTAGQDICVYADSGMSAVAGGDWYTGGVEFDFEVYQYTMDADNINDLVKVEQWGYAVTSSGQTRYAHAVTYDTYLTDAVAADIRSGKKAISTTGLVTGTATFPTGTKNISITQNGTTTEDVSAYENAQITVNVPSGGGGNDVIRTVVVDNSAGNVTFDSVLAACESLGYTLTYSDAILFFRAQGATANSLPPNNYTYNNHTVLVKNGAVWNASYNRCNYKNGTVAPDTFNGYSYVATNNAIQNSGAIISDHEIVNTYASAFQGIGGAGTTVTLYEIPVNWSDFATTL